MSNDLTYFVDEDNTIKGSIFSGWTRANKFMAVISVIVVMICVILLKLNGHSYWWATPIALVMAAFNLVADYDRVWRELIQAVSGFVIKFVLKDQLLPANNDEAQQDESQFARTIRRLFYSKPPIPLSFEAVQADGELYGVLPQSDNSLGHMFVAGDGSEYGSLDPELMKSAHRELSLAMNRFVGMQDSLDVGISMVRLTRPGDMTTVIQDVGMKGNPFMVLPERFDLSPERKRFFEWLGENFEQLIPTARSYGASKQWMVVVASYKWDDPFKKASAGKLTEQQLSQHPLIELGQALLTEVKSLSTMRVQNPRVMGPAELAFFVKSALDVFGLDRHYMDRLHGRVPVRDEQLQFVTRGMIEDSPDQFSKKDLNKILGLDFMWPRDGIVTKHDRVLLGETWYMIIREKRKRKHERVDGAQMVHYTMPPGTWDSFATVSESTSGEAETRQIMIQESARRSFESFMTKGRNVVHPRYRRQRRKYEEAVTTVSSSSINQRWHRLRVLAAPKDHPELLDKQFKLLKANLVNQGIMVNIIKGRARLVPSLVTALLGTNRL